MSSVASAWSDSPPSLSRSATSPLAKLQGVARAAQGIARSATSVGIESVAAAAARDAMLEPFHSVEELQEGVEHMQESWTLSYHREAPTSLCVHGTQLFSAGRDRLLILYDLSPTAERAPPTMLASYTLRRVAHSIAADRNRVYAATGSADIDVIEWSEDEGMLIGETDPLEGHTRTVTAVAVHDGLLYSSANDCTVRLWDGRQLLMTLAEGVDPYGAISVAGDRIASCAHAGGCAVSLWRFSLLQVKAREYTALPAWATALCAGPRKDTVRHAGGRAAAAAAQTAGDADSITSDLECLHSSRSKVVPLPLAHDSAPRSQKPRGTRREAPLKASARQQALVGRARSGGALGRAPRGACGGGRGRRTSAGTARRACLQVARGGRLPVAR